jgi:hypothetical protein
MSDNHKAQRWTTTHADGLFAQPRTGNGKAIPAMIVRSRRSAPSNRMSRVSTPLEN